MSCQPSKLALQACPGYAPKTDEKGPDTTFPYQSTQTPTMPTRASNLQILMCGCQFDRLSLADWVKCSLKMGTSRLNPFLARLHACTPYACTPYAQYSYKSFCDSWMVAHFYTLQLAFEGYRMAGLTNAANITHSHTLQGTGGASFKKPRLLMLLGSRNKYIVTLKIHGFVWNGSRGRFTLVLLMSWCGVLLVVGVAGLVKIQACRRFEKRTQVYRASLNTLALLFQCLDVVSFAKRLFKRFV